MENFVFGMEALLRLMSIELAILFHSEVIRGFLVGYVVATLVYGFLETSKRHRQEFHGKSA